MQTARLTTSQAAAVSAFARAWQASDGPARLARRDATLWTGTDESRWLGWLDAPRVHLAQVGALEAFAGQVRAGGFTHALLIGMGGSSMCPEVLAATRAPASGYPMLYVLDSTDPNQIRAVESRLDLARTLVLVASKSGGTLEPNLLVAYFLTRLRAVSGPNAPARQCVAITDPGSSLEQLARREEFWRVFHGVPEIGGRYSALSNFGLVPAALLGMNIGEWLRAAATMASACLTPEPASNPGVALGLVIGAAARGGRDKLTLVGDAVLAPLAPWIEQLVAESLGKHGKGVIPIVGERLETPERYADDRVFVRFARVGGSAVDTEDPTTRALDALAAAGHPVVTLEVGTVLAPEFVRWSVATAVAGHVLGVNPFDQPDVEAAKLAARALAAEYEAHGALHDDRPTATSEGLALYTPGGAMRSVDAASVLGEFLSKFGRRDYLAILAFIEMSPTHDAALATLRGRLRTQLGIATTIGYGPRYLHSSGQLHKGGPESGVFIIVTCDEGADLAVPGQRATFGVVKLAQARGDFNVLASRGRRVLRVHVGADVRAGLQTFTRMIDRTPS